MAIACFVFFFIYIIFYYNNNIKRIIRTQRKYEKLQFSIIPASKCIINMLFIQNSCYIIRRYSNMFLQLTRVKNGKYLLIIIIF